MIIATRQCGCPPKKEDPPCPPCCTPAQRRKSKPEVGCGSSKSLKSIISRPKVVQQPACCPIKPEYEKVQVNKIHSEIKERGLTYKELEVMINNNKLVVRTQKELPREEFEPPCDCTEDPRAKIIENEKKQEQVSDNRTLTLFPKNSYVEDDEDEVRQKVVVEEESPTRILEENPNIFRLRVKKKSKDGQNIDFEFRTPRPWSKQMREKHEKVLAAMIKSKEPEATEDQDEDVAEEKKKQKKKRRRSSGRRKKKDECEEILAKPPCGEKKKRRGKTGNC